MRTFSIERPIGAFLATVALLCAHAGAQTVAAESVNAALSSFDPAAMVRADKVIGEAIAAGKCPGAVLLVGRGDAVLYEKGYGNRALQPRPLPMTADTVFDLASLTKPVATATAVMLLAERGKIKLSDPVAKYLPAFSRNGKEAITVADLLLHVGGLMPDDDLADYATGPAAAIQKVLALPPAFKPNSRFAYSDVGYIVLGELVRQVDGRSLDAFAREEIYRPLGMLDTGYMPGDSIKSRCAPTDQRGGHWMIGEVHDPRAYALGGIAGHAGVFSTAGDLSRFCRMILAGGTLNGTRVLKETTVAEMILPRPLPGDAGGLRAYGFDVDTAYSSVRGERFERGLTVGHTGFTGTALWLDPIHRSYFILLTNSVHPDGNGSVKALRHDVATAVAEALYGPPITPMAPLHPLNSATLPSRALGAAPAIGPCLTGIDVLRRDGFRQLAGRKVGLITNQTGRDRDGNRTVDLLAGAKNLQLVRLFSPEHGIDGILDEKIANTIDVKTGLKVFSLYGPAQKPTPQMLEGIDTLVFDIQDVGTRFYTYITTMGLCMQAASEQKIRFVILDRPNPNTGLVADGPLADSAHLGFTAFGPLPLVHGMTVGEVARFYNVELRIGSDLQIVAMENWRRRMWWDETGLMWINPSPNLRNPTAALLYPAVGLLEASNVSVGRGTDQPFEIFGAPWADGRKLACALNDAKLPGLRFVPITFEPRSSKFAHEKCQGVYVEVIDRNAFEPARAAVAFAWQLKTQYGDKFQSAMVEKMLQNSKSAAAFNAAKSDELLPAAWEAEIALFRSSRARYLLYQ